MLAAFQAGDLDRDVVVVVRFQGPRANGMPELHKLTPALGVLQDRGHRVALVTDGRMSGASGKVPAAIHVSPEACPTDRWRGCATATWSGCAAAAASSKRSGSISRRATRAKPATAAGTGRELFALMRNHSDHAESGASAMLAAMDAELR